MSPTEQDYEKLARTVVLARGGDPDAIVAVFDLPAWECESLDDDNDCVSTTRDTLDDFRRNSRDWREPGSMCEVNSGLYWKRCQAMKGQPRCELCVVDCGEFRLCYQV